MEIHETRSENETREVGFRLAGRLRPPAVVMLSGSLGAGKTVFARGFVLGLGASDVVKSPSFSLVNVYETPAGQVFHVDLYRLNSSRDLHSIGLEEILSGDSMVIIEWADKLASPIPGAIRVRILVDAKSGTRRIEIGE